MLAFVRRDFFSVTLRALQGIFDDELNLALGTIQILRKQYFGLFLTHPLCQHKYTTECQPLASKIDHSLDLPNQSFADVVYGRAFSFGSHIWCAHYRAFIVERTLFPFNYASWKLI